MLFLFPGVQRGQDLFLQRGRQVWRRPLRGLQVHARLGPGERAQRQHQPERRAREVRHVPALLRRQVDPYQRAHLLLRYAYVQRVYLKEIISVLRTYV